MSTIGRRGFVASSLATGFALAVRPVAASAIATDATGLVVDEIRIGELPAYRAAPEGKAKLPLVVVVHEIFGVHEHVKDLCRRLAKKGYLAIAPDLFARQGGVASLPSIDEVLKVVAKVPDAQVMRDLDATVAFAKKSGRVDGDRVGITGFCWGGRVVWLYAAHTPAPKAGVAWYGRLSNAINARQTTTVLDVAGVLKAPVLGLYGGADPSIPIGQIEMMRRELDKAKSPSEIVVYPDAPHGFNADYRPSYRKEAAEDAWSRMLAWFAKHGV